MRKAIKEKILQQKKDSQFYVKMICGGAKQPLTGSFWKVVSAVYVCQIFAGAGRNNDR